MRVDQRYNRGGFKADHPSGNVLDEFVHEGETERCLPLFGQDTRGTQIRIRHYAANGSVLEDRLLTEAERNFFFPVDEHPPDEDLAYLGQLGHEHMRARINR